MENKKEKLTTSFCQDAEYKCTEANYTAASTTIDIEDGENCCCQNEWHRITFDEDIRGTDYRPSNEWSQC